MTSKQPTDAPTLATQHVAAFESILEVFQSPGWKLLEKQLIEDQRVTADIRNAKDLQFAQGQLSVLDNIVNWPAKWAALYDMAQAGDVEIDKDFGA